MSVIGTIIFSFNNEIIYPNNRTEKLKVILFTSAIVDGKKKKFQSK